MAGGLVWEIHSDDQKQGKNTTVVLCKLRPATVEDPREASNREKKEREREPGGCIVKPTEGGRWPDSLRDANAGGAAQPRKDNSRDHVLDTSTEARHRTGPLCLDLLVDLGPSRRGTGGATRERVRGRDGSLTTVFSRGAVVGSRHYCSVL